VAIIEVFWRDPSLAGVMPASHSSFAPIAVKFNLRLLFFFCRITDPQAANIGDCDATAAQPQVGGTLSLAPANS
jgi:hypothetical protein